MKRLALLLSIFLHFLLFGYIFLPASSAEESVKSKEIKNQKQQYAKTLPMIPMTEEEADKREADVRAAKAIREPECAKGDRRYTGIGLIKNWGGVVEEVPVYYPAYKAGIRIGDYLLYPDNNTIIDGYMTVELERPDTAHTKVTYHIFKVKVQEICYK